MRLTDIHIALVCGGREYRNYHRVETVLNLFPNLQHIIHGDSRGADSLAKQWAELHGVKHHPYPADWNRFGKGAGQKRNRQMIDDNPNIQLVIAFPGGGGTLNMCTLADYCGFEVKSIDWDWKKAAKK